MSNFQDAILNIPANHRCVQMTPGVWNLPLNYCFFGVPQSDYFGWSVLDKVPVNTRGFHFYLGADAEELILEFSKSEYPQQINSLVIGNSSFNLGGSHDYRKLIRIIENTNFPNLKQLELGVWELFHNSHSLYGTLGDISTLLKNTPNVEKLELFGLFDLPQNINLPALKQLKITQEGDLMSTDGPFISNSTLGSILETKLPALEVIEMDLLHDEDQYGYEFPETFLLGNSLPKLKNLEISGGFKPQEKERLMNSALVSRPDFSCYVSEMVES